MRQSIIICSVLSLVTYLKELTSGGLESSDGYLFFDFEEEFDTLAWDIHPIRYSLCYGKHNYDRES